jgi:hypothetical protein
MTGVNAPAASADSSGVEVASMRGPIVWGAVVGVVQAASPLAFWWLTPAAVYGLGLAFIPAVYIGFAVAYGRSRVLLVECLVASVFVLLGAVGITGAGWLLVAGYVGHGLKDLWQHRTHYVANTRWWPPFCLVVDWVLAAILVVLIVTGVQLHP